MKLVKILMVPVSFLLTTVILIGCVTSHSSSLMVSSHINTASPSTTITFKVFQVQSPLSNERFIKGETICFKLIADSDQTVDPSQFHWTSSLDGALGNGLQVETSNLSVGTHNIKVTGYEEKVIFPVRVYNNLWELYKSEPAQGEIDRISSDFEIICVDGEVNNEKWSNLNELLFDQQSAEPTKMVLISELDVLRHQDFSEPLPFTSGLSIYDYFKKYVKTFKLTLDNIDSSGGGGQVWLPFGASTWDNTHYVNALMGLVHLVRLNEPGDPGHVLLSNGLPTLDEQFENGSGYAISALYCMWVYRHGLYDTQAEKDEAKLCAMGLLDTRFVNKPVDSNPEIQAILDELMPFTTGDKVALKTGNASPMNGLVIGAPQFTATRILWQVKWNDGTQSWYDQDQLYKIN